MEGNGDAFIDRNKVRILVCDNDSKSCQEVFSLLCKCSYQVTAVRSPRQVIDALNAEGPDIDIILCEVDLPMSKGLKLLKYIMRDKGLRRIPIIMMSAQDEVSLVVKCLKLGAADYLVKPLRTNELLNLWTHMWRRRRMLGLVEKNIVSYDIDSVVSDPSDANTNSTTLFSDDTDDKSRKSANAEICLSTRQEPLEINANGAPEEPHLNPKQTDQQRESFSPFTRKRELKIGGSSAFFTYVKSTVSKTDNPLAVNNGHKADCPPRNNLQERENPSINHSAQQHSLSMERSSTPPMSLDISRESDEFSQKAHKRSTNRPSNGVAGCYTQTPQPYPPYYISVNPSSVYQKNLSEMPMHGRNSSLVTQYSHIPHIPNMGQYPYYHQYGLCLQTGQMPMPQNPWPSFGNSSSTTNEGTVGNSKLDRREAALIKFRQKRKERCFDKKIRYVNRKKLAERRPRLRGQFVRKVNGIDVDLNGQPASAEDDEDDEEEYDEEDPSNEDGASLCS